VIELLSFVRGAEVHPESSNAVTKPAEREDADDDNATADKDDGLTRLTGRSEVEPSRVFEEEDFAIEARFEVEG
jgi:hypothetical protein